MRFFTTMLAAATPGAALAANRVSIDSDVFVERIGSDADGRPVTTLAPPRAVTPGDRLVFVLSYRNGGAKPASGFVITNPVPHTVAFAEAADGDAELSVDGGRNWGKLGALTVSGTDGRSRPAAPADVTHVRWRLHDAVAAGATGKLSYRAVAR
jgi:uncharacterized repeat protein (TIGR01451 family)